MLINHKPWHRRHDDPSQPIIPAPPSRCYPNSRKDLIDTLNLALKDYSPNKPLPEVRGNGSHWALSEAAIARDFFVETQDPEIPPPPNSTGPFLNRTLGSSPGPGDVIPGCLTPEAKNFLEQRRIEAGPFDPKSTSNDTSFYLYHVEAGIRLYELYSRLDSIERPLALQTMGGAGGQTIVGAFSTGTHGADVLLPPLADCVVAIHLIAPTLVRVDAPGQRFEAKAVEYWLERPDPVPFVDEAALQAVYGKFPDEPTSITVLRNDDLFNAALVSVGRFGLIYSVVLMVGWQYSLRQTRTKESWGAVKSWINDPTNAKFPQPPVAPYLPPADPRFVQVVVNPNAQPNNEGEHTCWVTFNHKMPVSLKPAGRDERRGSRILGSDPAEFTNAGLAAPYPPSNSSGTLFNLACSSASPVKTLIVNLLTEATEALVTATLLLGALTALSVLGLADPAEVAAASLAVATATVVVVALTAVDLLTPGGPLGNAVGAICNWCAANGAFWLVQEISEFVMGAQQPTPWDQTAISYAILDTHDYTDIGCDVNIDSLEVFFDAADTQGNNPLLLKYVESIFQRIIELEHGAAWANHTPQAFAGYVSLRFMLKSAGLIAMQQFKNTCAMEIAGFNKVGGTMPFLHQIEMDAIAMGGTVHWGQRNDLTVDMVEMAYGAGVNSPLARWRRSLGQFSAGGRLQSFSTSFSRARGLEIVQPTIESFTVTPSTAAAGTPVTVQWQSGDAPGPTLGGPGTRATLKIDPSGQTIALATVDGKRSVAIPARPSDFSLVLEYTFNGHPFTATGTVPVHGT